MESKIIRLFVSSTFDDFRKEREILQTNVFPRIKQYCINLGYTFQPIDLRWGISNEAQFKQKTLELCLNEVRSCKSYPYPNFLIMIGDRYGWIPLPYAIEKDEFEILLSLLSREEGNDLLSWYEEDLNQLPSSYVLKERTEEFVAYETWNHIEQHLRLIFQKAAKTANISDEKKRKYFTSATEAEVIEGIFPYFELTKHQEKLLEKTPELLINDSKSIFGLFRDIEISSKCSNRFIADDYDRAQRFKSAVKAELLGENMMQCKTVQIDNDTLDEFYLSDFIDRTFQFLKAKIDEQQQKEKKEKSSQLQLELEAQTYFAQQKRKNFIGQDSVLKKIEDYINDIQPQPLVIYGKSGIGKSSIMAKAIENSIHKERKVIFRFIGATPDSIYTKKLLSSIFQEIGIDVRRDGLPEAYRYDNPEHIPEYFYERETLEEFSERIADRFMAIEDRMVIFIDAVDRLSNDDQFSWLPEKLPANLKMIISVLSNEDESISNWSEDDLNFKAQVKLLHLSLHKKNDDSSHLNNLLFKTKNIAFIGEYKEPINLLYLLLNQEDRTIQKHQEEYFLKQVQNSPTPFYVYVAAQEMKSWKSYDSLDGQSNIEGGGICHLADTQQGMVRNYIENLNTLYHHDKKLVQKVFGYIYASQDGLSESEILELLSTDKKFVQHVAPETWHENIDKNIPLVIWTRLLGDIKAFLSKRQQQGEELLYFFHREFEEVIISSSNQKQEHENIILATQEVLIKQYSYNYRCRDIYIQLITNYYVFYDSNLEEYSIFVAKNIFDNEWIKFNYIYHMLDLSKQFKSYNHEERKFKLACLLSAGYTTEVLFHSNEQGEWSDLYLIVLEQLVEVYARSGGYDYALMMANVAYNVAEHLYAQDPRKYTNVYIKCLKAVAWYNHQTKNDKEAIGLFNLLEEFTSKLYSKAPDQWSQKYAYALSTIALSYRSTDKEKSLYYYKAALDIAEIQYEKYPYEWNEIHTKYLNDYNSFFNYEISLFLKIKYKIKGMLTKKGS
ncbi:DUF4062 domain-containing protein [Haliscomenobacter sp.]|uniref:DUF4062 domain-containing protein n=1 Tax=Haliscomenobacter sp. TaxID=2717303 RepID=UPI003BAB22A4